MLEAGAETDVVNSVGRTAAQMAAFVGEFFRAVLHEVKPHISSNGKNTTLLLREQILAH